MSVQRLPITLLAALATAPMAAQTPITRADAIAQALAASPRIALGASDTAAALAGVRAAHTWPNPSLSLSYTGAVPRLHGLLDVPLDVPWLRGARTRAAELADTSARFRYAFARAELAFDADTAYTRALAARARADLSRRTAAAADTLLQVARTRRDAGDASDLEVELATVSAGTQRNTAADDSLASVAAVLDLQLLLGRGTDRVELVPVDSLALPTPTEDGGAAGMPLPVASAAANLASQQQRVAFEHKAAFAAPTLQGGVEGNDPTGAEAGPLPVIGVSVPLPLFNQNGAAVARAEADVSRAAAELELVRRATNAATARALRERDVARERARRDQLLLASANRVAAMSVTAYREGAATLPSVIEAQRSARDQLNRYVDDVAAVANSEAELRLLTLTAEAR